jgi:sporulation-control protein spo0M
VLSGYITKRDMQALEYLTNIRYDRGVKGMLVEFYFQENPYFENKVRLGPVNPSRPVAEVSSVVHRRFFVCLLIGCCDS